MATRDIVVIGTSAGGVSTLTELAGHLGGFRGQILIVMHMAADSPGVLPSLLATASGLTAAFARDNQALKPGHIYVGPPDHHLLVRNRRLELSHGPKENRFRPAVDPLFRTAAQAFGPRVVGIVLSGGLDDGTDGLRIIQSLGGIAIAQDPKEAMFPSMPTSAIRHVPVNHVAPLKEIARLIRHYAAEQLPQITPLPTPNPRPDIAEAGDSALRTGNLGPPSALTCPDCGGALWEFTAGNQLRYRCHVGHFYTGDGLKEEMHDNLEQALWTAVRTMEEASALRTRMAAMAKKAKWSSAAPPYARQAQDLRQRADLIRTLLLQLPDTTTDRPPAHLPQPPRTRQSRTNATKNDQNTGSNSQ